MTTAKVSDLMTVLEQVRQRYGDIDVALWDLDTGWYFNLQMEHIELQRAAGAMRLSIGPNSYSDERAPEPDNRGPLRL